MVNFMLCVFYQNKKINSVHHMKIIRVKILKFRKGAEKAFYKV